MAIQLGSNTTTEKIYLGSDEVQRVYIGNGMVWEKLAGTPVTAPTVTAPFSDQVYVLNTAVKTLDFSTVFDGENISFTTNDEAVLGINRDTGEATFSPDELQGPTTFSVTANNSGGSVTDTFTIEVVLTSSDNVVLAMDNRTQFQGNMSVGGAAPIPTTMGDGVWYSARMYMDGTNFISQNGTSKLVAGFRQDSTNYIEMYTSQMIRRAGGATTGLLTADLNGFEPEIGWTLFVWQAKEEDTGARLTLWITGASETFTTTVAATNMSLYTALRLGESDGDGPNTSVFDVAYGTGDPAAMFAWAADPDSERRIADYDFAGDSDIELLDSFDFSRIDQNAPNNPALFNVTTHTAALTGSVSGVNPWVVSGTSPTWRGQSPFKEPPLPVFVDEPTLSLSGTTFTMSAGSATGLPGPVLEGTEGVGAFYFNGVDRTAEVVAGEFDASLEGFGQGVLVTWYENPYGYVCRVLNEWILDPAVASSSGEDNAVTYTMQGVAHDEQFFQWGVNKEVGHYKTGVEQGDPYIVSSTPVSITAKYPKPYTIAQTGRVMNGSMLDPVVSRNTKGGFDSFSSSLSNQSLNVTATLPYAPPLNRAFISSVSTLEAVSVKRATQKYMALFTVSTTPKWDAMRPELAGNAAGNDVKSNVRVSDIVGVLSTLDTTGVTVPLSEIADTLDSLRRPRIDTSVNWNRDWQQCNPAHLNVYGRDFVQDYQDMLGYVLSDAAAADKESYVIGFVQQGRDIYHAWKTQLDDDGSFPWNIDGGHNFGRKALILFAGYMLNDAEMLGVMDHSVLEDSDLMFQEDAMTKEINQSVVDATNGPDWGPQESSGGTEADAYQQGMVDAPYSPSDWRGEIDDFSMNAFFSAHSYRVSNNHEYHHITVTMIYALGLEDAWGHQPFLDYHPRHVAIRRGEPDPWILQGGVTPFYNEVAGGYSTSDRYAGNFTYELWSRHFPISVKAPWL